MKSEMQKNVSDGSFTVDNHLICRGDGRFYMELHVKALEDFSTLQCTAHSDETIIPSCTYPFDAYQQGLNQIWVLEAPLMEAQNYSFWFYLDDKADRVVKLSLSSKQITWMSRINYRLRNTSCMRIRDFEQGQIFNRYQITFTDRFNACNSTVWRTYVTWTGAPSHTPTLSLINLDGSAINAQCLLFELQLGGDEGRLEENRAYYSLILPTGLEEFVAIASDDVAPHEPFGIETGFGCMHRAFSADLQLRAEKMMMSAGEDPSYSQWFLDHKASDARIAAQRKVHLDHEPTFSIIIIGSYNEMQLERTLDSIEKQSYPNWTFASINDRMRTNENKCSQYQELVNSSSEDYVVLVKAGDTIEPDTLFEYAQQLLTSSSPSVLFCDEDTCDSNNTYVNPIFKTQLNLDLLYCQNCVGHLLAFDRSLLANCQFKDIDFLASNGYPLVLHAIDQKANFIHVPRVLYHKNSQTDDSEKSLKEAHLHCEKALAKHLAFQGISASVSKGKLWSSFRVKYDLPSPHPLVSIIIPSKDHIDVLEPCVSSILETATYDNYEILIIENNSTEKTTFEYYDRIASTDSRVRIERWDYEFNYSKIINFGAAKASGSYLLLLNNDTKVISADFIEEMMGFLQRPDVGVVGAKLFFRDKLVQHAGMAVDPFGAVAHVNQNFPAEKGGYRNLSINSGNFTSVTGACQMVRTAVFQELGGYDEAFAVGFNDIDFCMRLWDAGYRVVFTPHAQLYHYEFTSRGRELADAEKLVRWKREHALIMERWPKPFVLGDPFVNPNLKPNSFYYGLS